MIEHKLKPLKCPNEKCKNKLAFISEQGTYQLSLKCRKCKTVSVFTHDDRPNKVPFREQS